MVSAVYVGEVADVETVDERQIYLGIFDIDMSLQFAGIFHSKIDFLFSEVVLAEYVKSEFLEVAVET